MIVPSRRRRESVATRLFGWFKHKPAFGALVLNGPDFAHLIKKERMRADRRSIEVTLIQFEKIDQEISVDVFEELCVAFRSRLRITDDLGVLDDCLSVLLPDTPGDGGCKVALELSEIASSHGVLLHPHVFVYPDDSANDLFGPRDIGRESEQEEENEFANSQETVEAKSVALFEAKPMLFFNRTPRTKRAFDLFAASCGMLAFAPVMIGAAIWIKISSTGPVFFKQLREGKDQNKFVIYKFRTMVNDAESQKENLKVLSQQDGPAFKLKNDPRTTRVGAILRKTCVDELPQLINVLRGEMSMVGPRPLPVDESEACDSWQRRRLDVLPGMTCIWQVDGGRDVSFDDWMRMDLDYIERRTIGFDLKLLAKTAAVALHAKGSV